MYETKAQCVRAIEALLKGGGEIIGQTTKNILHCTKMNKKKGKRHNGDYYKFKMNYNFVFKFLTKFVVKIFK